MNEEKAREILGKAINSNNTISDGYNYMNWPNGRDNNDSIILDGDFTADELEATAWWMRNKKVQNDLPKS